MKKMIVMSVVSLLLAVGVVSAGPNCGNHKEDKKVVAEKDDDHENHAAESKEEHEAHAEKKEHKGCSGGHSHDKKEIKVSKVEKKQSQCPIMGNDIDKKIYLDHDGHRMYACSEACKLMISQDFETYETKLSDMGQSVEKQ